MDVLFDVGVVMRSHVITDAAGTCSLGEDVAASDVIGDESVDDVCTWSS